MFIIKRNIALLSIILFSNVANASEPIHIGAATSVVNTVLTTTEAGEKKVQLNDELFFKQQIITKEESSLTVTFRDSSTFSIAPQSVVILDEFIFNPSENVSEKSVKLLKGSFRYISGFPIKSSSTKIVTPFGTAGIRGSAVQGSIAQKSGFTVNVASGSVIFETPEGKKSTVNEGESLSVSPTDCTAMSPAVLMQSFDDIFAQTSSPTLTPQQTLANATANNVPAVVQKESYAASRDIPVNPQQLKEAELSLQGKKITGNPQAVIQKLMQDLQSKNKSQIDSATQDTIATAVAIDVPNDKITQIAMNAVMGAKSDYKVTVAATVINTLLEIKPELGNEIAVKLQQMLPVNQQRELRLLVPTGVLSSDNVEIGLPLNPPKSM